MGLDVSFDLHKAGQEKEIATTGNIRSLSYLILRRFIPDFTDNDNIFSRNISAKKFSGYYDAVRAIQKKMRSPEHVDVVINDYSGDYIFRPKPEFAEEIQVIFPGYTHEKFRGFEAFLNNLVEKLWAIELEILKADYEGGGSDQMFIHFNGWR